MSSYQQYDFHIMVNGSWLYDPLMGAINNMDAI